MLKKSITYTDFDGNEVTEEHYFHLTKADLIEMQMGHNDTYEKDGQTLTGYQAKLQRIIDSNDGATIMQEFKDLILSTYGQKSADGKRFIKTPELRQEFASSEAYSSLFVELCTDANSAGQFVSGLLPRGMDEEIAKIQDKPQTGAVLEAPQGRRGGNVFDENESEPSTTPPPGTPRVISPDEARNMPHDELQHLLATGQGILGDSSEG